MSRDWCFPPRRVHWLCGAALLALAAPAAHAQSTTGLSASRIVIDPTTGRPRLPDHDEVAAADAARSQRSAVARTAEPSALKGHPVLVRMSAAPANARLGAVAQRIDPSMMSFSVVRRTPNGELKTDCVAGEDAATHARHAKVEGGDDHAR